MGYNLMFTMESFSLASLFQTINAELEIPLIYYFYSVALTYINYCDTRNSNHYGTASSAYISLAGCIYYYLADKNV